MLRTLGALLLLALAPATLDALAATSVTKSYVLFDPPSGAMNCDDKDEQALRKAASDNGVTLPPSLDLPANVGGACFPAPSSTSAFVEIRGELNRGVAGHATVWKSGAAVAIHPVCISRSIPLPSGASWVNVTVVDPALATTLVCPRPDVYPGTRGAITVVFS